MSLFHATLLLSLSAPQVAFATDIHIQTADGISLFANEEGRGEKGIVLIHDKGQSSEAWGGLPERLAKRNFHVVAIDLRGHGKSSGEAPPDADYMPAIADVNAAIAYLQANGSPKISLIGASLGANLAANAASTNKSIENLIMLSPGMNYKGVRSGKAVETYGERPLLLVASETDAYAIRSTNYLEGKAKGLVHSEYLGDVGDGTRMVRRSPSLENTLVAWMNGTYFLNEGKGGEKKVSTGDNSSIETTGTKFGENR